MTKRISVLYSILFWIYIAVIVGVSLNPKGGVQQVSIFEKELRIDYILHAMAFSALPILVFLATRTLMWSRTGIVLLFISLGFAVGTEYMQLLISGRTYNPLDIASNISGLIVGLTIAILTKKFGKRKLS